MLWQRLNTASTLRTTKAIAAQFHGFCGNLKFYPFVFLQFCIFVCICYTSVCVLSEPNCIVCITLSRNFLIVNPEVISSNQGTGTNTVTTCQTLFVPSAALAQTTRPLLSEISKTGPHSFSRCQVLWLSVIIIILFNLPTQASALKLMMDSAQTNLWA